MYCYIDAWIPKPFVSPQFHLSSKIDSPKFSNKSLKVSIIFNTFACSWFSGVAYWSHDMQLNYFNILAIFDVLFGLILILQLFF